MADIWGAFFRTLLAFLLLMAIAILAGWHARTQKSFLDIVLAVVVGVITAMLAAAGNLKIWPLITALLLFGLLSYAYHKLPSAVVPLRKLITGFTTGETTKTPDDGQEKKRG